MDGNIITVSEPRAKILRLCAAPNARHDPPPQAFIVDESRRVGGLVRAVVRCGLVNKTTAAVSYCRFNLIVVCSVIEFRVAELAAEG